MEGQIGFLLGTGAGTLVEDETVAVGRKDEWDIKGCSIFQSLLHSVTDVMVVILGFYKGDGDVGFVVKDAVSAFGFSAGHQLSADDNPTLGETHFLANLGHLIPPCLLYGGNDELGANVAFGE